MKPFYYLSLMFTLLLAFQVSNAKNPPLSYDNDKVVIDRELKPFDHLVLSGVFNVKIESGDQEKVVINTREEILEYITIENKNNKLTIKTDDKYKNIKAGKINILVVCKELSVLKITGVGNVESTNAIKGDDLELFISSVGKTELNLKVNSIMAKVSAVGDISIIGSAEKATINTSGVGNFNLSKFIIKDVHMVNSGIGNVSVHATENLDLTSSGIGQVNYFGNPNAKNVVSSGIGKVNER